MKETSQANSQVLNSPTKEANSTIVQNRLSSGLELGQQLNRSSKG